VFGGGGALFVMAADDDGSSSVQVAKISGKRLSQFVMVMSAHPATDLFRLEVPAGMAQTFEVIDGDGDPALKHALEHGRYPQMSVH
jgi:hypothetical protein